MRGDAAAACCDAFLAERMRRCGATATGVFSFFFGGNHTAWERSSPGSTGAASGSSSSESESALRSACVSV